MGAHGQKVKNLAHFYVIYTFKDNYYLNFIQNELFLDLQRNKTTYFYLQNYCGKNL